MKTCRKTVKIPTDEEVKSYGYHDVFALLVPSCCDKSGTSCNYLVTRLMTVTDLLLVVLTRQQRRFITTCYGLVVISLLTISNLLEQLVAGLLSSST